MQTGARADNSWLGVPILAGERAIGLVGIESPDRHAFSESDERLLSTLASAMGVALENARLFDETKRLLAETEQRNGELAVVNEIGAALAQQLDFDAIIELVGNRLATMVDSPRHVHRPLRPGNEPHQLPVRARAAARASTVSRSSSAIGL